MHTGHPATRTGTAFDKVVPRVEHIGAPLFGVGMVGQVPLHVVITSPSFTVANPHAKQAGFSPWS